MDVTVERSVVLDAPVEEAWRAVTDPDELAAWMGGEVELDLRPGGVGVFHLGPDGDHSALVTEVDPGRRLAMLWWPLDGGDRGPSSVELVLAPVADGGGGPADRTLLRVVERATVPATLGGHVGGGPQACALLTRVDSRSVTQKRRFEAGFMYLSAKSSVAAGCARW